MPHLRGVAMLLLCEIELVIHNTQMYVLYTYSV